MLTHVSLSMNVLIYTFVFSSKHMRLVFSISKKSFCIFVLGISINCRKKKLGDFALDGM